MNRSYPALVLPVVLCLAGTGWLASAEGASTAQGSQAVRKKPAAVGIAIPAPKLAYIRLVGVRDYEEITGDALPSPTVRVEFWSIGGLFTKEKVTHYRLSERSDFSGATWKRMDAGSEPRKPFTVSPGSGRKTIYAQVSIVLTSAGGGSIERVSATRKITKHWTDPVEQALATLERLACLHTVEYRDGAVVAVRCPLANTAKRLKGLGDLALVFESSGATNWKLELKGSLEGKTVAKSATLEPMAVAGIVRVTPDSIRTKSTSISVKKDTLQIRFDFESSGVEFRLALAGPDGSLCDACLPDMHWNNASLIVNLTFGGSPTRLTITEVSVSSVRGAWDLAGNPAGAAVAALRAVGINGAAALRATVSRALSERVQSDVNSLLAEEKGGFEEALVGPLAAGFSAPGGRLQVGYQTMNSSIIAEFRP